MRSSLARRLSRFLWLGALAAGTPAAAQQRPADSLATLLSVDPLVTVGSLPNGMRYYLRPNPRPAKRAELRLVVKAGSVLEDPDQRGLAHMLEHMAFNGTAHFAANDLVSYLESVGMQFGPDINASTGFDETVYMLQLPTDSAAVFAKGFQILEDWAHAQTLDPAQVDKERPVVIEEWRLGRGAGARMRDAQLPVLLRGSRYAERIPIGDTLTLRRFPPAALRRFYTDWYRPDLMAVVAVGDFDAAKVTALIREHFGAIPAAKAPRPRERFGVPDNDTTLVTVATDMEATGTSVAVYFKLPKRVATTVGDYRARTVEALVEQMLNQRLFELTQKPDAPFINASASRGAFIGDKDVFVLGAVVKDGGISRGLEAVLTEAVRAQRHGFATTELDRAKQNLRRSLERAYAEREKTESVDYAEEYVAHFLGGEPIPGIAAEVALQQRFLPSIGVDEVNAAARTWMPEKNRAIAVQAPAKPGVAVPAASELLALVKATEQATVAAYEDKGASGALVERPPAPATIAKTETIPEIGVTRWTLSNGVRVMLKPTDFKADQVLLRGSSPGGTSLLAQGDFAAARGASVLVQLGGVGAFDRVALQKALAGKAVSVAPDIGELAETIAGQASPQDLETMLQLVYLYFTAPRADSAAVLSFKQRQRAALENRGASPEAAFYDTLQVTLTNHHARTRPITAASIDSLDLARSLAFYRDRYADASDFTFIIVGSFTPESIAPLVRTWLGGLPSQHRVERWRDVGITTPGGVVTRTVRRGTEPKAQTQLIFSGAFEWTIPNRRAVSALEEVLRIRLRDVLREALSGTYGVEVESATSRDPRVTYQMAIGFGSAPDRAEALTKAVFAQIDSLQRTGPTAAEVEKVREIQRRTLETGLRENGFWLSALAFAEEYGEDPRGIANRLAEVGAMTPAIVQDAARRYLDVRNYVQVRLLPQD
jgi:zinc protease